MIKAWATIIAQAIVDTMYIAECIIGDNWYVVEILATAKATSCLSFCIYKSTLRITIMATGNKIDHYL